MAKHSTTRGLDINKILIKLVTILIFPLRLFFKDSSSKYHFQKRFLQDTEQCYCNSGLEYRNCCKKADKKNNVKVIQRIKTNIKTGKTTYKLELVDAKNKSLKLHRKTKSSMKFKQGSINPMNRKGNYIMTNLDKDYCGGLDD